MVTLKYFDRPGYASAELEGFSLPTPLLKPQAALFRVLSGTCTILHDVTGQETVVDTNYFIHHFEKNENCSLAFLDNYQEGLVTADYDRELRARANVNRKFYNDILDEVATSVVSLKNERHVDAFLHLYRCYERLAYAFPMIYAAKNPDYLASFDSLRKWLSNANPDQPSGELAFLRKFLSTYEKDELYQTIDFDITGPLAAREVIFKTITNQLLDWSTQSDYIGNTTLPDKVSVPFAKMHEILLKARNRYFHQSSGRADNLGKAHVVDADLFFSILTPPLLSYIAQLFHDVFAHNLAANTEPG